MYKTPLRPARACMRSRKGSLLSLLSLLLVVFLLATFSPMVWARNNVWTSLGSDGVSVGALPIDPQNPGTIYAATGGKGGGFQPIPKAN